MKLRTNRDPEKCCAARCRKLPEYVHQQPEGEQLWWCRKHSAEAVRGAEQYHVQIEITSYTPPSTVAPTTSIVPAPGLTLTPSSDLGKPEVILSPTQIAALTDALATAEQDLAELRELELTSHEDALFAEEERSRARHAVRHWDTLRKSVKEYWVAGAKRVDDTVMPAVKALRAVDAGWSRAINTYRARVAEEQQRLLREAQLASEAAQAAADTGDVAEAEQELAQAHIAVVAAAETEPGTRDIYMDRWRFEIVDAAQVPREYLCPDLARIGQIVRALGGDCVIPGVRVWNDPVARSRG